MLLLLLRLAQPLLRLDLLTLGLEALYLLLQVHSLSLQLLDLRRQYSRQRARNDSAATTRTLGKAMETAQFVTTTAHKTKQDTTRGAATVQLLRLRTLASSSAFRCSAISAFRIPNAMLDSYSVWYAAIVIRISSRTRSSSRPRSAQLIVTCRMSSSVKHERNQAQRKLQNSADTSERGAITEATMEAKKVEA
jgi:hypothetical protein